MRRGGSYERRVEKMDFDEILGGRTIFGHWRVLGEGEPYIRPDNGEGMRRAICVCVCGNEKLVPIHTLKQGHSNHCGCRNGERNVELHGTHLMSGSPEYRTWSKMKERCANSSSKDWHNYGGRGITVCKRWRDSFAAFYADLGPKPTPNHSIDRIDVDGNYEPGNVRWETGREQMQNVRHNVRVEFGGETLALKEACRRAGVEHRYKVVHRRISRQGMSFAEAIAKEGISA